VPSNTNLFLICYGEIQKKKVLVSFLHYPGASGNVFLTNGRQGGPLVVSSTIWEGAANRESKLILDHVLVSFISSKFLSLDLSHFRINICLATIPGLVILPVIWEYVLVLLRPFPFP
jgi:hypothetical protein